MQIESSLLNFSNYTKAKLSTAKKSEKEIADERAKVQEKLKRKYYIDFEESLEPELSVELDTYEVTEEDRINIKVQFISDKLKSGAELSDQELDFLSKYAPGQHDLALRAKKEREQFEKEAKNCSTKSDVQKLKNRKDSHFVSNIKIAEKNGDIGEALKQITLLAQVTDEHRQFVKSKNYREKPDKHETEILTNPSLI